MQTSNTPRVSTLAGGFASLMATVSMTGDTSAVAAGQRQAVAAVAPYEIVASGFEDLSALAVEASGAVLVTDRAAGTLARIDLSGQRRILLSGLQGPSGVAVDRAGGIFVVEAGGRRVVRRDTSGVTAVVASELRQPRSIAIGTDGRVWIAMRKAGDRDERVDDSPSSEYVIAWLGDSGVPTTVASGFLGVEGLAAHGTGVYVAMTRLSTELGSARTSVARVHIRSDGVGGGVEPVLSSALVRAKGLAVDRIGDLFVTGSENDDDDSGVILKRHGTGQLTEMAGRLSTPVALAIAPNGDLLAVEKGGTERIIRFRAPQAPAVSAPEFTYLNPVTIAGRSGPGDRVQAFHGPNFSASLATTVADSTSGEFYIRVPLDPNAATDLSVVATAVAGAGLAGPATAARIVHDDQLPRVVVIEPAAGAFVRETATLHARGEDDGSGVASVAFVLDDATVAAVENSDPARPLAATARLDVLGVAEGAHSLTIMATDRAGNSTAGAQLLIVDRTPPDTIILGGPRGDTAEQTGRFTVAGIDVHSTVVEFAWRMDRAAWSPFGPSTTIDVDFAPGAHLFEVMSRDLAGNEDPSPAAQAFTAGAGWLQILEPAEAAVISTDTVWIRGSVDGSRTGVAVSVSTPPELRTELRSEVMSVAQEAGTFAVELPVTAGMTSVMVTARDGQGQSASDVVGVSVQSPLSRSLQLQVFPAAGFAPHPVRFAAGAPAAGSHYSLDLESDGTTDYEGEAPSDLPFTYARPGIHVALLRVTTPGGDVLTARTSVEVYDRTALGERLRVVWNGFKEALRSADVPGAVSYIHSSRRGPWEEYFRQFTPAQFGAADRVFTDLALLDVGPGSAECEMMRDVGGLLYSFPVSFLRDVDGVWRLWQF